MFGVKNAEECVIYYGVSHVRGVKICANVVKVF